MGVYHLLVLRLIFLVCYSFAKRSRDSTLNLAMDKELNDLLDFSAVSDWKLGTSLLTSNATNQRVCSKGSPWSFPKSDFQRVRGDRVYSDDISRSMVQDICCVISEGLFRVVM